jgi:hypothetical protein
MTESTGQARAKRDLIIETWTRLGCPAVDEKVLREIQHALGERFGTAAIDSPASIARVLADENADLRHPEVIEFDARWRESELKRDALEQIRKGDPKKPLTLKGATATLKRLENLRKKFASENDVTKLRALREAAINEKTRAQLLARDAMLRDQTRSVQMEIVEWFRVWLEAPDIFNDWLELRRRSREYQEKFSRE